MLKEISCDQFNEKNRVIVLRPGLNTVLGTSSASNSIGKSTFLMILDFVFGGHDYIELLDDVQNEVGNHAIKFTFEFNGQLYRFYRTTEDPGFVYKCYDSEYHAYETDKITLAKYENFLEEQYHLINPGQNLRNTISRFIRVYPRDTLNTRKKPLNEFRQEKDSQAITGLLKILGLYEQMKEINDKLKETKERLSALEGAKKYSFIASKKGEENIEDRILELEQERLSLLKDASFDMVQPEVVEEEVFNELNSTLSEAKRKRSRLEFALKSTKLDAEMQAKRITKDFSELQRFFPDANIAEFTKIEEFHKKLISIFKDDCKKYEKVLTSEIDVLNEQIGCIADELEENRKVDNASRYILKRYSAVERELKNLKTIIRFDNEEKKLKEEEKASVEEQEKLLNLLISNLQNAINKEMNFLNDCIFNGKLTSPVLSIDKPNKYSFKVASDGGSGASYRGVIVFDVVMQKMAHIPLIVHDSDMLKLIQDETIEKILEIYQSHGSSEQQIFISIDKKQSYPANAQKIINDSTVLTLTEETRALFGRSWNRKDGQNNG